jgi:hypothetical protein
MRSPLDETGFLSENYQRHNHTLVYNLRQLFCNAKRCWRLCSLVFLFIAGVGLVRLGGYMATSKITDSHPQQSNQKISIKENYRSQAVKDAFVHGIF